MRNKITVFIALLFVVLFVSIDDALAVEHGYMLEKDYIQSLKIVESKEANVTKLRISGLVFHSSLGIKAIDPIQIGTEIQVNINLAPASAKNSGNLDFILSIPSSVKVVSIGLSRSVIWKRGVE
jgi:hypothetical protein